MPCAAAGTTTSAAATRDSLQEWQQQQQQHKQQQQKKQQSKRIPFQHFPGFFRDVGEGAEEVLVEEGAAVDLAIGAEEDLEGIQPAAGQRHQLACNSTAHTERLYS